MRVVVATHNAHKLAELRDMLGDTQWQLEALPASAGAPEETGQTFIENALIKARAGCAVTGQACLADDSGLMVDALGGAPGLFSARYAGVPGDDRRNNERLMQDLAGVPRARRGARYVCALVLLRAANDPRPLVAQGLWRGVVLEAPRGTHGFGYDPLVYLPAQRCSVAELAPGLKARLSHRARAMQALLVQWRREQPVGRVRAC